MDFDGYWQENKRFVTRVALGVIVFFAALFVVDALYAEGIAQESGRVRQLRRDLEAPMFGVRERDASVRENEALRAAAGRLAEAVRFAPLEHSKLEPARGSAANQYLRALADARERVLLRAGRAGVVLEPGLGMPKLSPTEEEEIERYLEALDAVEAVAFLAIEARAKSVEDIQVRLDPGLASRAGFAGNGTGIERTLVRFKISGDSLALTRVLSGTQRSSDGRVLHVDSAEVLPARGRRGELTLELTLVLARLSLDPEGTPDESGGPGESRE